MFAPPCRHTATPQVFGPTAVGAVVGGLAVENFPGDGLVLGGAECAWTTWKRRGASETRHTIDYLFVSAELGVERVLLPPSPASPPPSCLYLPFYYLLPTTCLRLGPPRS